MKRASLILALLLAAAPAFAGAQAQPPVNRFAATEVAQERFDVGVLQVERHGQRGRPLILVPGVAGGAWVWQDTIRKFRGSHSVYVVTLPGFDGRARVPGNMMEAVQQSLRDLVTSRQLAKPVLVGHGLGGMIALAVAQDLPGLVGGVVSIDGLPVVAGTEELPPEQRAQLADGIVRRTSGLTPEQYAAQQQQYLRGAGVLDMGRADELAKLSSRSDPEAAVQYTAARTAADLRPGLSKITAPVMVIAPYFELDEADPNATLASKVAYYRELMTGTPKLDIMGMSGSRHYVMIDQPERFTDVLRGFLNSL
ncbi:alpha/beta fold hydrolase [Massilia cavernae]|uniref:Alpha/beta hydrolase n=1 Tax=Massilia cavernae TaxID=2320864 RepID=A0A418XQZ9_9BURK|nr:alpha/beta hydrolase [Massilia cavernae]RJG14900.1 alpha/beta hydrolase [Massilia cavernae]